MYEIKIGPRDIDRFATLVGAERVRSLKREAEAIRGLLDGQAIWNVNSTVHGGGVAEMLRSLLRYARGLRIDARWAAIQAPPEFFRITKRLHNALHGFAGDGSPLGAAEASLYERVLHENVVSMDPLVQPRDIVICHDPQTAGLVPHFSRMGAFVVWRSHIGEETWSHEVERGWAFLRPYLQDARVTVFTRASYAPPWLQQGNRAFVVPPNIDPFSAKNQSLDDATVHAILSTVGLIEGPAEPGRAVFLRDDGSAGRVDRKAEIYRLGCAPGLDVPLVTQISRWDHMKDPVGVLRGFARLLEPHAPRGAQLVLAGPTVDSVTDDPESSRVFADVHHAWRALPESERSQVHLAMLPMEDDEENAAIVNALQRHASVIVQKSLEEGFGLTVTEALWKRRPVIASAVGGIQDQIRDGLDGLLVRDPEDLGEFAAALTRMLDDAPLAKRLADSGYERVRTNFLSTVALERWAELVRTIVR